MDQEPSVESSIIFYSPVTFPPHLKEVLLKHGDCQFPKNIWELREMLVMNLKPVLAVDMFLDDCRGMTSGSIKLIKELKNDFNKLPIVIFSSVPANHHAIQTVKNNGAEEYIYIEEFADKFPKWLSSIESNKQAAVA